MTDRPILFSGPMVRALLEGRKTQTRRVLNPQPYIDAKGNFCVPGKPGEAHYNFGRRLSDGAPWTDPYIRWHVRFGVGDRLYVRENWQASYDHDLIRPRDIKPGSIIAYDADRVAELGGKLRVAMHMPRWASRLTLTVTDVRVQRLQEIDAADAIAEGVRFEPGDSGPIAIYAGLWDSLNADRAPWASNPWVVAVTFDVARSNIDQQVPP